MAWSEIMQRMDGRMRTAEQGPRRGVVPSQISPCQEGNAATFVSSKTIRVLSTLHYEMEHGSEAVMRVLAE